MKRVVAVAAMVLLTACSGSPNTRPKTKARVTTTTASTSSTSTSTTVATTTSTTSAVLAKPCAAADLGIDEIQSDGASQHRLTSVSLLNTSAYACSLSGFPASLTATDQDGKALDHVDQGAYQPDPPAGDVAPGESGVVIIDTKTDCATSPKRLFKSIQIGLPGGGTVSLGDYVIDGTCGVATSKLGVHK